MGDLTGRFRDKCAFEGVPVRFVIVLVMGVASLAVMTSILGGLATFEPTEVTADIDNSVVTDVESNTEDVVIHVRTFRGEPVNGATILISGGTASMDAIEAFETGAGSNSVQISVGDGGDVDPTLRSDQYKGTLTIELQPPTDGNYVDDQDNPEMIVTR